jgi:hypothetical protein
MNQQNSCCTRVDFPMALEDYIIICIVRFSLYFNWPSTFFRAMVVLVLHSVR